MLHSKITHSWGIDTTMQSVLKTYKCTKMSWTCTNCILEIRPSGGPWRTAGTGSVPGRIPRGHRILLGWTLTWPDPFTTTACLLSANKEVLSPVADLPQDSTAVKFVDEEIVAYPVRCLGQIYNKDIFLAASLRGFSNLVPKPQQLWFTRMSCERKCSFWG